MLDDKKFKENYNQLQAVSEYGADLFAGQAYREMMTDAGLSEEDSLTDGIEMQCAAESVSKHMEKAYAHRDEMTQSELMTEFAEDVLREKLTPFSEQEKKTLMISMLDESRAALNQPLDERERVQLTQKETADIQKILIEQLLKVAESAWGETDFELTEEEQDETEFSSDTFSKSAAMGAVYLQNETLRDCPELIGSVTGASCTMQKQWDMEKISDDLDWISMLLMLLAISIVVSLLLSVACGVIITSVDSLIAGATVTLFEEICFVLKECVQVFAFELKVALGTAAAGLAAKAASVLCRAYAENTQKNAGLIYDDVTVDTIYAEEAEMVEAERSTADKTDRSENDANQYEYDDEEEDDSDYA